VVEDVEARLRAALRAHADLVEAPPHGAAAPPPGLRRSHAGRRWGAAALIAAAAAAVVAGVLWVGVGGTAVSDRAAAPSADDGPVAATVPSDGPSSVASAAPSAMDAGRPFDLSTHCGVLGADIGGVWFVAEPPLTDGQGNPPEGWGDPYQPGTLTMLSATQAVFRDDAGHEVQLRADDAARPALCD
jgi:hypothetical protein